MVVEKKRLNIIMYKYNSRGICESVWVKFEEICDLIQSNLKGLILVGFLRKKKL